MSRTINMSQKVLQMIDIQVFVDASLLGPCPVHMKSHDNHLEPIKD